MPQHTVRARSRAIRLLGLFLLAGAGAAAFGACTKLTEYEGTTNRYGAVNISAKSTSATAATARATATFFEAVTASVPNSTLQPKDVCQFAFFDSLAAEQRGQHRAGDAIGLTVGSTNISLPYEEANLRYATPATQRFSYEAGNVVQATVPGLTDVFPATGISVKLAEPIIPGPVTVPLPGQPLAVTWNATNDESAVVNVSLRYRIGSGTNVAMEQLLCSARDDGQFEIPSSTLENFRTSPASFRSVSFTRFRTNLVQPDDRTVLFIGSSIDTVVTLR